MKTTLSGSKNSKMCIIVIDFSTDELKILEDHQKDLLQNLVDKKDCLLKINKYKGVILKWLLKKENQRKKR